MHVLNQTPFRVIASSAQASAPEPDPYYPRGEPREATPVRPVISVRVKGTFRIDPDAPRGKPWDPPPPAIPVEEAEQLDFAGDTTFLDDLGRSLEYGGDLSPYKGRPEFLVYGHCYQPGGKNAPTCPVAVAVGDLRKRLLVSGAREWLPAGEDDLRVSSPVPFTEMPLRWELAYGGLTDPKNPMGKGQELGLPTDPVPADPQSPSFRQVPNIEYPSETISQPSDRPDPAGLGPLLPHWLPRATAAGKRDQRWATFRAPLPPQDYSPLFHNLAPADQHFPNELDGTEPIRLENLHPKHPLLEASLPRLRLRMFVAQVTEQRILFHEAPLRLDTIHLFPEKERLVLLWRQHVGAEQGEYTHLCLASEPATEPAQPLEHYREVFWPALVGARPEPEPPPLGLDEAALQAKVDATMAECRRILAEGKADPALQDALKNEHDPSAAFELLMGWLENLPVPPKP